MKPERTTQGWSAVPPFQKHMGIETVEAAEGRTMLRYRFAAEHGNRKGDVHGGVLATIMDLAISQAIRSLRPDLAGLSTINMTVNFLDTANGNLIARGKALKVGGSIAIGEATCETEDGRPVVQASAAFRLIRHKTT